MTDWITTSPDFTLLAPFRTLFDIIVGTLLALGGVIGFLGAIWYYIKSTRADEGSPEQHRHSKHAKRYFFLFLFVLSYTTLLPIALRIWESLRSSVGS